MNRSFRKLLAVFIVGVLFAPIGCGDDDVDKPGTEEGLLTGTVTLADADHHAGILVTADEQTTTTDDDGAFQIARLSPGEVEFSAEMDGYVDHADTVEIEAVQDTIVDVELTPEPSPPVVERIDIEPDVLFPGESAEVTVSAYDPDESQLQYTYEADGGFEVEAGDDPGQATLTAPDEFNAQGQLTVTVEDEEGLTADRTVDVATESNDPPVIESLSAVPGEFEPGETGDLTVQAYDPQGSDLAFQWNAPDGWHIDPDDESDVELTAPEAPAQFATIEVEITDAEGAATSGEIDVSTRPAQTPEITELTADPPQTSPGDSISLSVDAYDPDGGDLEYNWSAPAEWTIIDGQQPETTIVAPDEYGRTAHLEIEVTSEFGASQTAQVLVSTVENLGPHIDAISADPTEVERGGTISLYVDADHPEEDELDYQWDAPAGWDLNEDPNAPENPTLTAPDTPGQTESVEVTVTDSTGIEAVASVLVRTRSNLPPVIESLVTNPPSVVPGDTVSIEASAYDPDDIGLSYDWDVPSGWDGDSASEVLDLTAPDTYGESATVTLTVDDGTDTTSASVTVSTVPNLDPVIASFDAVPAAVERGGDTTLTVDAFHPYGESVDYDWSLEDDDVDADDEEWSLVDSGDTATLTAPDVAQESVTVNVTVSDDHGGSAEATLTVTTRENSAPVIDAFSAEPSLVERGGESTLSVDATDPDGGSLEYTWSTEGDPDGDWTLDENTSTATLTAPDVSSASVTVVVEVVDDHGDTTEASVTVETEANQTPVITSVTADPQILNPGEESTLSVDAYDPNGEPLDYDWAFADADDDGDWTLSGTGATTTLTASGDYSASTTIVVTVSDGYGGEASSEISVTTTD